MLLMRSILNVHNLLPLLRTSTLPLARLRPNPLNLIILTAHRDGTIFALSLPLPLDLRRLFVFLLLYTSVNVAASRGWAGNVRACEAARP